MDRSVIIRPAEAADAAAMAAIYAPYVLETTISFEEVPLTPAEMAERLAQAHACLAAEEGGQVVGYAYGAPHRARAAYRWSVDVTVYLAPAAHRRGLGRALYGRLFEILRERGFHAAFAGIALPNAASVGLHEAMGFTPIGVYREVGFKFGRWWDVGWWQLRLTDGPPPRLNPHPS